VRSTLLAVALAVACASVLALSSAPSCASPSWQGYSGLFLMPTADVLGPNKFGVNVAVRDKDDLTANWYSGSFGLRNGLEIGVTKVQPNPPIAEDTVVHAKYQILPAEGRRPAVAVGVFDITDEINSTVYVVASKEVSKQLGKRAALFRVHAGVGGGQIDQFMFGGEAVLGEYQYVHLLAEHINDQVNMGARFAIPGGIKLDAVFLDLDTLGLGATYCSDF